MILKVEFTVRVPNGTPQQDAIDWVEFELKKSCELLITNPLYNEEIKAETVDVYVLYKKTKGIQ